MAVTIHALCDAGRLVRIARAGRPPLGDDDAIELTFDSGDIFHIDTGPIGASDIVVREGSLLDHAFGHLVNSTHLQRLPAVATFERSALARGRAE